MRFKSIEKSQDTVVALAVLHNLALEMRVDLPEDGADADLDFNMDDVLDHRNIAMPDNYALRRFLINNYFQNL